MQGLIRSPASIWGAFCKGAGATLLAIGFPIAGFAIAGLIHRTGHWQAATLFAVVLVGGCALIAGTSCALGAWLYRLSYDRLVRDGFPDER